MPYRNARAARRPPVRADSLEPVQQPTPPALATQVDYYCCQLIKHPAGLSAFHSFAEYLHAGLLEGDPAVRHLVPQPFRLRVNGRAYIPDYYAARTDGPIEVGELKPRGEFDPALHEPLSAFFAQQGWTFKVVANEALLARQREAENWLEIVRALVIGHDIDTTAAETDVLARLAHHETLRFGELLERGQREQTYPEELAALRLLHRGRLHADLASAPFGLDTRLRA
jgi:hypothetical protein